MITKNTKTAKIFAALVKAAMAEGFGRDVIRDLGPDPELNMAVYETYNMAFEHEGCYGDTIKLFGTISYTRYNNGDESVHWSVSTEGQKFYFKINTIDVEECQKAVKTCCDKLTRAAAKGAHQKMAEFRPFPAATEGQIGVYTSDTQDGLSWYVCREMCCVTERADKAEEE